MKITKITLALLTTLGLIPVGSAEETIRTSSVEVTATLVERELKDVPMSMSVIGEEQIKQSGATTIAELLENEPGLSLTNDGSQGLVRVGIRGENSFRTLVLIDGQKISEHKSMTGDPLLISPSIVERIEVIKGPASVQYGADALGGVINIITKKEAQKNLGFDLGLSYDSKASEGFAQNASLYGKHNGFNFRLSGAFSNAGDLKTPDGHVKNTDFQSRQGSLFLSYDINSDTTVGFSYDIYNSEIHSGLDELGDYIDFAVDIPTYERQKAAIFFEKSNVNQYLAKIRFDAFYQTNYKLMDNLVEQTSVLMNNRAENDGESTGLSLQADWQLGDYNYLISGIGASFDNLSSHNKTDVKVNTQYFTLKHDIFNDVNAYQNTYYAFLSNETILPYDFTVNYGARYTFVESALQNNHTKTYTTMRGNTSLKETYSPYTRNTYSKPVVNFGVIYEGISDLALRLTYAQGFRSPILQEKYTNTSMGGVNSIGNPNLKPETSDNYEFGARLYKGGLTLDAALFLNKIDDYITTLYLDKSSAYYANIAKAQSFGSDISLSYQFENGLKPYAQMTFMRRKFETLEYSTYNTDTPKLSFKSGLNYEHDFGNYAYNLDLYLRGASKRRAYDSENNTINNHGYTTANAEFNLFFGKDKDYSLSFKALNLLDKDYKLSNYLSEPGRHFVISANASF